MTVRFSPKGISGVVGSTLATLRLTRKPPPENLDEAPITSRQPKEQSVRRLLLVLVSKKTIALFGLLFLLMAVTEVFGISMLFPIMVYLEGGEGAFESEKLPAFLSMVLNIAPSMGLPINLLTLCLMAFVPILLRQFLKMGVATISARVEENTTAKLRMEGVDSLVRADLPFFENHRHGDLISSLTLQAHAGGEMASLILTIAGTALVLLVYVAMLMAISLWMTLIAIGTGVFATLVVSVLLIPRSRRSGTVVSAMQDEFTNSLNESLSGVRIIKMLAQEQNSNRSVFDPAITLRNAHIKLRIYQSSTSVVVEPIFILGVFVVAFVGFEYLDVGLATLGILFLTLLRVMPQAQALNQHRQGMVSGLASYLRYAKVIEEATEASKIKGGTRPFPGFEQAITFDAVSYSYYAEDENIWALRDVSLSLPKGKMTALVGRSGAGKSTLIDLIPRLRDASQGAVLIDGVNVKEFILGDLRRAIGFVNQETFLFNDTIRNNIAFGLPSARPEQVEAAAMKAFAHEFILEAANGYETVVGDRGVRLSAGQRQRLGIARTMLQNPEIIILDEPTSALDSESELYIRNRLDELRQTTTIIVIAHRLSTIQQADKIIVLDQGRIVEHGSHSELLDKHGDYSRLFDIQIHT